MPYAIRMKHNGVFLQSKVSGFPSDTVVCARPLTWDMIETAEMVGKVLCGDMWGHTEIVEVKNRNPLEHEDWVINKMRDENADCEPDCPGWGVFWIDQEFSKVIMKCDTCGILESDDEAIIKALEAGLTIKMLKDLPVIVEISSTKDTTKDTRTLKCYTCGAPMWEWEGDICIDCAGGG